MRPPSCLSVYLRVSPIVARQGLEKHVLAATNTHAAVEELLDASFSMRSVSHHREVLVYVCYITTLSEPRRHSVGDRMDNEYGAVDGMRIGRGNLPRRHFVHKIRQEYICRM
jgi:hypothetical protein